MVSVVRSGGWREGLRFVSGYVVVKFADCLTRQCGWRLEPWPPGWENPAPTRICGELVGTFQVPPGT